MAAPRPSERPAWWWVALLAIILGSGALLARAAWSDSVTNDEAIYIHSGACTVNTRLIDLEPTNPAGFKLMAGAGVALSGVKTDHECSTTWYTKLLPDGYGELRRLTTFARIPAILVTLALILVSALWATAMGGRIAGLLAAAFIAFDPTVIAHGHIATGDIPVTLGIVGCLAALWTWQRSRRDRWLLISGVALGFALLNKTSAVALFPLALGALAVSDSGQPVKRRLRRIVRPGLIVGAVSYLVVAAVYAPFRNSEPVNEVLPRGFNWLIPQSWIWGANWQRHHVQGADAYTTYVNGERHLGGTLIYFPEALLLKMTIGALVAVAIGLAILFVRRVYAPLIWCVIPAALYLASAMLSGVNVGIRYVAPTIVLILIAAAVGLARLPRKALPLAAVLAAAAIVATALGPVGSMGYFNALAVGRNTRYLGETNVDFGQDGWRLRDWWERVGRPPIQVDMFGGLPARAFVPTALDVGGHGERLDRAVVADVPNRILVVSVMTGTLEPERAQAVRDARCYIGTGLVVVTQKACP